MHALAVLNETAEDRKPAASFAMICPYLGRKFRLAVGSLLAVWLIAAQANGLAQRRRADPRMGRGPCSTEPERGTGAA